MMYLLYQVDQKIIFTLFAEISCGPLNDPLNGRVQLGSSVVGSLATYSCNNGYNLVGVSQRICRPSGEWSGDEPRCTSEYQTGIIF